MFLAHAVIYLLQQRKVVRIGYDSGGKVVRYHRILRRLGRKRDCRSQPTMPLEVTVDEANIGSASRSSIFFPEIPQRGVPQIFLNA